MPTRCPPRTDWIAPATLGVLALACLILGGSSRADAPTLLFLRPIVVCCLIVLALRVTRAQLAAVATSLWLLGAFAATIAVQLVPIPAALWATLQGRAPYAAGLAALGLAPQAHPLSLTPDRTWNSLLALLVPLAVLLGHAAAGRATRAALLPALIAGGMASAVLGIAQLAAATGSAVFLYRSSNGDYPVGFFANRNHEAAFLAIMFPALRAWVLAGRAADREGTGRHPNSNGGSIAGRVGRPRTLAALAIGVFLVPMILATGSRAGFALMLLGLVGAWAIAPVVPRPPARLAERWALLAGIAGIVLLVVVTIASGRAVTVQRVIATHDVASDLRVAYLPTVGALIARFWVFGSGFGSFDPVLRGSEPDALLHGSYFNNAHDDLLELAMTGGLPAMLVLAAFLLWWGRGALAAFRAPIGTAGVPAARAAAVMIAMLLAASLLDYPLRTPLLGGVLALLSAWLMGNAVAGNGISHRASPIASAMPER